MSIRRRRGRCRFSLHKTSRRGSGESEVESSRNDVKRCRPRCSSALLKQKAGCSVIFWSRKYRVWPPSTPSRCSTRSFESCRCFPQRDCRLGNARRWSRDSRWRCKTDWDLAPTTCAGVRVSSAATETSAARVCMFVLEATLKDRAPGGFWWMSSFGAGFSCHGALLEVE